MKFIVKYFPEITIKSKPVRKQFVKHLRDNLRTLLKPIDPEVAVRSDWDKITIDCSTGLSEEAVADVVGVLSRTPGIAYFLDVEAFALGDLHDIYERTKALWAERLTGKTFAVRCKRVGQHEFQSRDVEQYVGGGLNQHTDAAGVNLTNPEVTVNLEIRDDKLYIVNRRYPGLGGFPLGSLDPALSLISGGFDSTVASYLTMRRGMRTHFCFFNLGGRDHEIGVKEVALYLWMNYGASSRVKFVAVPFEDVVAEILTQVDNSQMGVVLKRMMMRAGSAVAEQLNVKALVTGESVAQVSSQTLQNLSVIDQVTDTLVLRPLITMDKGEIIRIAAQIGTEEFAANMPEYCGVISVKPTTRAKPERIAAQEEKFDFAVLDKAIENARYLNIDAVADDIIDREEVEVLSVPLQDATVIDVRHPGEAEQKPLRLPGTDVQCIPFYSLHSRADELDRDRVYMLYCDKGVMSKLHASHLLAQGFEKIKVYRPE